MTEECIQLKIPNSRQKLKAQFPQDPRGDFKLVFRNKVFKLQKAHLRLESGYFKKKCTAQLTLLQISQSFNIQPQSIQEEYFTAVLSCFYGNKIQIPRSQAILYYPIIKFLQVDSLLTQLRKDMVENISQYELFVLMKLAHKFNEQQCFQTCLKQLENSGFQQMNYNSWQLLKCPIQLFKLIIKTHNRRRSQGGKGLEYKTIDNFIKQYCQANQLGQDRYHQFKFELIDKTRLTAKQYKQIFMDQLSKPRQSKKPFMKTAQPGLFKIAQSTNIINSTRPMFQSLINVGSIQKTFSNQLTLQMENTFHKKQNQQLKQQKQQLLQMVNKLKQSTKNNQQINAQLQKQLDQLKQRLKAKDKQQIQHKNIINRFQQTVKIMQRSLKQKDIGVKKLQNQIQQLYKIVNSKDFGLKQSQPTFIESRIIPANLIGDIMKKQKPIINQSKQKNNSLNTNDITVLKSLDQEQIQQCYHSRLSFDIEPISTPKIFIPLLVQFLGTDGFFQNKLKLVYRRSDKYPQIGTTNSLRNRRSLVLLIRTGKGQNIGGYISVSIPQDATDYIEDKNAFIFSLSKASKFNVQKSNQSQAIFLSQHYLICFGNDLCISKDVLNEASSCDWSSSYQKGKSQEHGPEWLAGGNQFMIKDLQLYEVDEEEMVMAVD